MADHKSTIIVTDDYTRAVTLTRSIIANAQAAQQSLYEVCKGLKEMRDGKLYKELGYQNFEDYTQNEVGIKRRQAYTYIQIATGLPTDFVQSTAQIGTEKLALLAKLDAPTREAVTESVDVESVTVKELRAQISALTQERDENEHAAELLSGELDSARQTIESKDKQFQASMESKNREIDELRTGGKRRTDMLLEKIKKLTAELEEARSAPTEVAVEDTSRIEDLERQLAAKQKELDERPVQESLTDEWSLQRRGKFTALSDSLDAQLGTVLSFLKANDTCTDFGWFAQNIKNKLRSWNTKINELLSEDQKEEM